MSIDCVGLLAYSKCGRDRKRLFCVVDVIDENFVLIADGKLHKIEKPKKKRLKHLAFVGEERVANPCDNESLSESINDYEQKAR